MEEAFNILKLGNNKNSAQLSYQEVNDKEHLITFSLGGIYNNKFIDNKTIEWSSTRNRSIDKKGKGLSAVAKIADNKTIKHLFVKDTKKNATKYYYLGTVETTEIIERVTTDLKNTRLRFILSGGNTQKIIEIRRNIKDIL